jgi:hypothetical protein
MKPYKFITTVCLFFAGLLISSPGFCQTTDPETTSEPVKRKIGLSASLQNVTYGIQVPIFLTQKIVLAPVIGLRHAEKVGTDVTIALEPKYYYSTNRFAPYSIIMLGAVINKSASDSQEKKVDILAGIGTGAEYFLIPNFSFGVEAQLVGTFADENSNRFGNPGGMNLNLASVVTANIYFTR